MPAAIPFIVSAGATALGVSAVGVFVLTTATSLAVADYQKKKAERQAREAFNRSLQDRIVNIRSAVASRQYVLGTVRCGGTLLYAETVGTNRTSLDSVTAICANETTIGGYYIGDEFVSVADFPGEKYGRTEIIDRMDQITVTRQPNGTYVGQLGFIPSGNVDAYFIVQLRGRARGNVVSVVGTTITLTGAPGSASTYQVQAHYQSAVGEKLQIQFKNGNPDQTSENWAAVLTPDWTENHRLRGVTHIRTLMVWDENVYANGAPAVSGIFTGQQVDGHPFYDPRDDSNPATTSNPALLAGWWMTLPRNRGGCGIPSSWINWDTVATAANICDELITVRTLTGGGYEQVRRYQCHTVLSTENDPISNLEIILSSMAGRRVFTSSEYRIFAGAFRTASLTITDADIDGKSPITVNANRTSEIPPNLVTARFADANKNWAETSPKAVSNATYISADGHETPVDMSLQATTDARLANYLMGVYLETLRPAFAVTLSVTGIGENIALGDVVQLSISNRPTYSGKTFEVTRIADRWNGTFELTLSEIRPQQWALNPDTFTPTDPIPVEDLSYLWNVQPITGLTVDLGEPQTLPDGNSVTQAALAWNAVTQDGVSPSGRIEVRYQEVGGQWISAGTLPPDSTGTFITASLFDGTWYQFQVRVINGIGAASRWTGEWVEIVGTDLAAGVQGPGIFTWANPVNVETTSSSITKSAGGAAWNAGAHSLQSYSVGCFATARAGQLGTAKMLGLNDDPAVDANYTGINYTWNTTAANVAEIYESSILIASHGAVTLNTVFLISYDSVNVRYSKDGTVLRTVPATGLRLFADTSIFTVGGSWIDVAFGPQGGAGPQGPAGAASQSIRLSASAYAFTYDGSGALSPGGQSITFTASRQNIATATAWSTVPSVTLTGSGDTRTLSAANFGANTSVQVTATAAGFSDTITIVRLQQGATGPGGLNWILTNEAHTVSADPDGVVGSYAGASGLFLVYEGTTDRTSLATFAIAAASNCTAQINTAANAPVAGQPKGFYRITAVTADDAYVDIQATYGSTTVTRRFSITRSRQGVPGDGANLLRVDDWVVGSIGSQGSPLRWMAIDDTFGESAIVLGGAGAAPIGPLGITEPLWECRPDLSNGADGGWDYPSIPIDRNKTYRSVVWFRVNAHHGQFYHGCGYDGILTLGGVVDTNPYFAYGGTSQLEVGQWYLSVGLIHGAGYTGGNTGIGGVYDPRTGKKIAISNGISEYKFSNTATTQWHRAYHYYNTTSTAMRQWMARPRFEEVNGNEPSIWDLMGIRLPVPWIERGNCFAALSSFHKVGGSSDWTQGDVISVQSFTSWHLQFKAGQTNTHKMCGANSDPYTNQSYDTIDHAWYPHAGGSQIYESGGYIGEYGAYTLGTEFGITGDGSHVRYYKDRVLVRTIAASGRFYVDAAFYEPGSSVTAVKWGPGTDFETIGTGDVAEGAMGHQIVSTFAGPITNFAGISSPSGSNPILHQFSYTPESNGVSWITLDAVVNSATANPIGETPSLSMTVEQPGGSGAIALTGEPNVPTTRSFVSKTGVAPVVGGLPVTVFVRSKALNNNGSMSATFSAIEVKIRHHKR